MKGDIFSWRGHHGASFSLRVAGYQFPEITEGYDANWLTLETRAQNERGAWRSCCSCLLSWELDRLSRWLPAVVMGEAEVELSFLEPDLSFFHIGDSQGLSRMIVKLRHGLMPSPSSHGDACLVDVGISPSVLRDSCLALERSCLAWPPRGEIGRGG